MTIAIEVLPVMLDAQRILADQVTFEGLHRAGGRFQIAPGAGFPQTDDAGVRVDLDKEIAVDEEGFNVGDLQVDFLSETYRIRITLKCSPKSNLPASGRGELEQEPAGVATGEDLRR